MNIQTINFEGDRQRWLKLRGEDVTASVVGALFRVHPYTGPLALYSLKTGLTQEDKE